LFEFGYSLLEEPRMLGEACESSNEIAVAKLTLLYILSVEGKGYFRFLYNLIGRHPITKDIVLPL